MPAKGDTQINNFVKGYFTEATPLTFPQGASLDEINMKLLRNGSRERRLGLDYEDGATVANTSLTSEQLARMRQRVFVWPTPSGNVDYEIGVVQIGTFLFFLDLFSASPSSNRLNGGAGLDMRDVSSFITDSTPFDFAVINNNLLVVSAGLDTPFLLGYNADTDTILTATSRVKIRDLYGVNDNLSDNTRPATLSKAHEYNLRNQGWDSSIVSTCGTEVLECTRSVLGVYPSNSDTWSLGKIADVTSADIDKYDPETLKRNSFDLGIAAKGHFIIDLYNRGDSRKQISGIDVDKTDRELGRISTVTTLGGRAFYSGIVSRVLGEDNSPKLSGAVLFSQIVQTNLDLIKCYQEADPTSPNNSDIVDTDGGIIQITEASNIVKLLSVKSSVFVFAENGVWEIRGDEGGFRATSFQVNKISSIGVLARESIVEANGTIFFWAREGIFALTPNQLGTGYDTTNLTLSTIQTAYNTIPNISNSQVKGYYDTANNTVRWLFNNDDPMSIGLPDPEPEAFEEGAISSGPSAIQLRIEKITNTKYFIAYAASTAGNFLNGVVVTVNPSTLATTFGTPVLINSVSASNFKARWLQDNKLMIWYASSASIRGRILNFTGDTFTVGAEYVILASGVTGISGGDALSSSKVLIGYNVSSAQARGIIVNIAGDVITPAGTTYPITDTNGSIAQFSFETLSSSLLVFCGNDSGGNWVRTLSISGDVITKNATTPVPSSVNNTSSEMLRIQKISSTLCTIAGNSSALSVYASLVISGVNVSLPTGSITVGTNSVINTVSWGLAKGKGSKVVSIASKNDISDRKIQLEGVTTTSTSNTISIPLMTLNPSAVTAWTQAVSVDDANGIVAYANIDGVSVGNIQAQAIKVV